MGAPAVAPKRAPAPRRAPRNRASAPKKRHAPARRAASRRARPQLVRQPRSNPALAGAALLPHAAVSAAGAVRDLSDSSLILRLTRGRGWIAVLCALLGGIVALNVVSLSLNAGSGRLEQRIGEVERSNSALRAELAQELSSSRIASMAPEFGFYVPNPEDAYFLTAEDGDLERLLKLFESGTLPSGPPPEPSSAPEATSYAEVPASTEVSTSTPVQSAPTTSTPTPTPAPTQAASPPSGGTAGTGGVGL